MVSQRVVGQTEVDSAGMFPVVAGQEVEKWAADLVAESLAGVKWAMVGRMVANLKKVGP